MRLLLINPAEQLTVRANLPPEIEAVRGNNPPINLLQIAAAARAWGEAEVRLLDAHAGGLAPERAAEQAAQWQPELIGLTAVSFTMPAVLEQVAAVKRRLPDVPVWLGGLQPFLYPAETLALPGIDGLVRGEGERVIAALCRRWASPDAWPDIPGLYCRRGNELLDTGLAAPLADLDELPQPAYDLLETKRYSSVITDARPVANALTSRGCPYHCAYCSRSVTGKVFRAQSAAYVVETFALLKTLGYRAVLIYDEVFTIDKQRVHDICDGWRAKNFRLPWMARATIGSVDDRLLADLAGAGCRWITFGIESGSPEVLKRLNKVLDLEAAVTVFAAARRLGLKTLAYFMVGNPGETADDLRQTERLLRRLKADDAHVAVYTMYPATALYEQALATGLLDRDVWRAFAAAPSAAFLAPLWPGEFSRDQLFAAVRRLYRRFYLRPRRLLSEVKALFSLTALRRRFHYVRALLGVKNG